MAAKGGQAVQKPTAQKCTKDDDLGPEKLFGFLNESSSSSLLKKALTEKLFNSLKDKKTKFGGTLADCMKSGCLNVDSGVGIYASDPDAYETFSPVMDKVIMDYHKVDGLKHPIVNFGDEKTIKSDDFSNLDPSGKYVISTRVRVGRSHQSFGFPPVLTKKDREDMEKVTVKALEKLTGELKGTYYPLTGMTPEVQKQMTVDHFLFKDDDRFLRDAGGYDDWPIGRGIFHNEKKTFLVWVNEEDHMRFISMQKGGNLWEVYCRLVKALQAMEKSDLQFARSDKLGFLTFCPSNLGTALRASVHVKIPLLAEKDDELQKICQKYNVQARGIHGEHTKSEGGVHDISNKRRLGLTEIDAIEEMMKGVRAIIQREIELEGKS